MNESNFHEPVMVHEVIKAFSHIKKGNRFIDATLGKAGHTIEILKRGGEVLGIEKDPYIFSIAQKRLLEACPTSKYILINDDFVNIEKIAKDNNFDHVFGILLDLGVNNLHFKSSKRGFSFSDYEEKLDMRLNPEEQSVTAADLLNVLDYKQLIVLFSKVLPIGGSRKIAQLVVEERKNKPFLKVVDFLPLCEAVGHKKDLNSATLPFLALRMAVNSELDNLTRVLPLSFSLLEKGGTLAVITFHSEEDVIVKKYFGDKGILVKATDEEIEKNPKARSAKLRILKK